MKRSSTCFFFVDDIDSSFVKNELYNLSENYQKVLVVSKSIVNTEIPNVQVIHLDYVDMNSIGNLLKNFLLIAGIYFSDLSFSGISFNIEFMRYKLSAINRAVYLTELLNSKCQLQYSDTYYSFWMNEWATVLSILKKKKIISHFVSRVHGADLYEDRIPVFRKMALRKFQLKNIASVFSISKKGEEYLKDKYPVFQNKISTFYLGTNDFGPGYFEAGNVFTIVSCAKIRNIKRIHLIPEILKYIDFPIKWIHIGDENIRSSDNTIPIYLENVRILGEFPNIEYLRVGALSNTELLNYYKSNSVNLFISVSETEGLPVTMMEAISFGIPILSTNVGGCNEIVNQTTGILVSKNFDPKEVAAQIAAFKSSNLNSNEGRNKIREFWQSNFNNKVNFKSFIKKL